ncbi:dgat2, partial [Symbiodinium sp. KB8]
YYIPPQYYPFLKKLGDDTPELKPWMDKLINGEMTFDDYEEMFYQFAKPLKIHRPLIPMPYRTAEEMKKSEEVAWEGAWLSFRQRVIGDYLARHYLRDFLGGLGVGLFFAWVYIQAHRQYRIDMKLFYLEVGGQTVQSFNARGLRAEAPLAMWPTAAGVGMLVMMLLGALLIGYCVQVGRRKQEEVARIRKPDVLQETSPKPSERAPGYMLSHPASAVQAEIGQVLDCALSRPSSRGSRVDGLVTDAAMHSTGAQEAMKSDERPSDGLTGLLPTLIVVGSWLSGPVLLLLWTFVFLARMNFMGLLVVPSYLVMYKLPRWQLRAGFWLAMTLVGAASGPLGFSFCVTVFIFAAPVIFDLRVSAWPGFLAWMEGQGFKRFLARCELRGCLDDVKPEKTLFAFHPHGAVCFGFTANGIFDSAFVSKSAKIAFLIDDFLRNGNPIFRLLCDTYSTRSWEMSTADKSTVQKLMSQGANVALALGGFEEATVCETGKDRVVLKSRKGIIKYCLQHGYRIHPVYSFGEDETYSFMPGLISFRLWLNQFKIPAVAFFGDLMTPCLPRRQARMLTVVGEAIQCPQIPAPTQEDVDLWHARYQKALTSTFQQWKAEAGRPHAELEVRTVLESEIMDDEFEWARPATDILSSRLPEGRFTVEDLCTVYLQRQKPRPFTSPEVPRKPAAIRMEDLRDATAAAIFVAEELGSRLCHRVALCLAPDSDVGRQMLGTDTADSDLYHLGDAEEVWANTCQSNLLFEVWRPPDLVKDWEWELPAPPASLPAGAARVKPGRLKRSWTVSSEQWMPTSTRGDEPPPRTATAGIRPEPAQSAWLSDNGEFVRPTPLKARIRMEAPVPSPSPPATFHQRAATAAAWVFGRRQVPEPVNTLSQDQDPEAQADLLVTEMREQLKHTCKEPLQVRKLIFRDLQRQLHPDKNTECEEAAKHAFQKLMEERHAPSNWLWCSPYELRSAKFQAFALGAAPPTPPARLVPTPGRTPEVTLERGMPSALSAAATVLAAGVVAKRRRVAARTAPVAARAQPQQSGGGAADVEELEPFFEEVSGDDPLVLDLEDRLRKMNGASNLTLDMVLNPGTIVNTERDVILLRAELKATPEEDTEKRKKLEDKIEEKQMKIVNEMKLVMTDNLKLEFLVQAILSIVAFGFMCYDAFPWIPDLTWAGINKVGSKLAIKLFGVWGLWLFTVPALRARKPGGPWGMGYEEKRALDISFLVLPFVCIFAPILFKDAAATYWLSLLTLVGLYGWSFNTPLEDESKIQRGAGQDLNLPEPVMWAIKALDFGTGSERGARSEDKSWQDQLAAYEKAAEELAAKKAKMAESPK